MIEEQAKVVAVREYEIMIEAQRHSACGKCAQQSDCGQSAIAKWAASKMVDIAVSKPTDFSVAVGDEVIVGIDEKSFIRASVLLYFVPLVVMFAAGFLATNMLMPEWQVIIVSFLGLIGSFYAIKNYSGKLAQTSAYQLTILSVVK